MLRVFNLKIMTIQKILKITFSISIIIVGTIYYNLLSYSLSIHNINDLDIDKTLIFQESNYVNAE